MAKINQEEINKTCPGLIVGSPTNQCRYLINVKERGRLPPYATTDCVPGRDNPYCASNSYLDRRE